MFVLTQSLVGIWQRKKSEADSSTKCGENGVGEFIQDVVLHKFNSFEIRKMQLKLEINQLSEKINLLNFEKVSLLNFEKVKIDLKLSMILYSPRL